MAGVAAILIRLVRLVSREVSSFSAIGGNNLFLILFLFAQGGGEAAVFPAVVLGLLMLLPLSAHPLRMIPQERLALWPLSRRQRVALEVAGVWLSPATWLLAALLAFSRYRSLGLALIPVVAGVQVVGLYGSRWTEKLPALNPLYDLPAFPGRLGELVRKDLRQLLSYLDPYIALVFAAGGAIYLHFGGGPREVGETVTVLTVAILGTSAQCLFGLDGRGGFTRYRLMPLRGWQVLAAKDAAWMAIAIVLTAALAPLTGISAGLVMLAIGHARAVKKPYPQTRWRFTGGDLIPFGLVQVGLSASAGIAVARTSAWWALACAAVYVGSVIYYGREWERAV